MPTSNTETINKIAVSVARIEERMIRYDETSIELTKAIKGNGKPGLLDRVSAIENCHEQEKQQKEALGKVKEKRIVCVIEEYANLRQDKTYGNDIEALIISISALGRAA